MCAESFFQIYLPFKGFLLQSAHEANLFHIL